ncbi:hypothetical protein GO491_03060 [Flavobacteriaceae bacterium Ap0902]|nr:hypothetical protein [Flavobacteriaceae bacterium Ap0902]
MAFRFLDTTGQAHEPVDFYTRELHYDKEHFHIRHKNPLSEILDYRDCFQMYNANYSNTRYPGYTTDPNGNDALVDVIDPDYKYPIIATGGSASKIVERNGLKLLKITPDASVGYDINSRVKRLGKWAGTSRHGRTSKSSLLNIVVYRLADAFNVLYHGYPKTPTTEGYQEIRPDFIGGSTNTVYGFNPKRNGWIADLPNNYIAFFRVGNVYSRGNTHVVVFDSEGSIIREIRLLNTVYHLFNFYLKTQHELDILEYSTFDYGGYEDENQQSVLTEAVANHKKRISNLIKGK